MLSTDNRPFWIKIVNTSIVESKGWPLINISIPFELEDEINNIVSLFIDESPNLLRVETSANLGNLQIQVQNKDIYYGIWIPKTFPSLQDLTTSIFDKWHILEDDFYSWIVQYFELRLDPSVLQYYQTSNSSMMNLPPVMLITPRIINDIVNTIFDGTHLLDDLEAIEQRILDLIPDTYVQLVHELPAEKELISITVLNQVIKQSDPDFTRVLSIKDYISSISPVLGELVFLTTLHIWDCLEVPDFIIDIITKIENNPTIPMMAISSTRLLARYYERRENLSLAETNYKHLMDSAMNSWFQTRDLIVANIGLSRIYALKGDYFRSLTFYAFAQQGFSQLGHSTLIEESELEMERISLLSATQQLQSSLKSINSGNTSVNALLELIDGFQSGIGILTREQKLERSDVLVFLRPLIHSAVNLLILNQERVNQLYKDPIDFEQMKYVVQYLFDENPSSDKILNAQIVNEHLSYKDQKLVERISVFYYDGRHIGDYEMRHGAIVKAISTEDQVLFSSAMASVGMLVSEATQSDSQVDEISVGNKSVIFDSSEFITFALIAKSSNPSVKDVLKRVTMNVEQTYIEKLKSWDGNLTIFDDMIDHIAAPGFFTIDLEE